MDLTTAITSRRSVRSFKSKQVNREDIIDILQAANMAPSATNSQPWSFIVLEKNDLAKLHSITGEAFEERFGSMEREVVEQKLSRLSIPDSDKYRGLSRFYSSLGGAPAVIIVCVNSEGEDYNTMLNIASASAAVQNLMLAAWDRELGTCWMMGPLQKKKAALKDLLKVPASKDILAIIPIGYPEKMPDTPAKEEVAGKITWGL